jgi:hypothetical protein
MDAEQIVKLSPDAVRDLLDAHQPAESAKSVQGQRREERWPFAGAVEVWLPEGHYGERHVLATLHNLSPHGLAMRARHPISQDTRISLAIHEPSLSCYGHAIVRHCTRAHGGYLIGVEFDFSIDEDADENDEN